MNTNINQNVNGVNLLNKYCLDELRNILPQLQNYVGKRILTQSGRSAKFNIEHTKQNNFRCYLDISGYSIWLNCDVCTQDKPDKNGISCSTYFKKNIYLGEMLNTGELKSVQDVETIAKNYNLDKLIIESEVLEQIKQHKELLSKVDYIKTNFPLDANLLEY